MTREEAVRPLAMLRANWPFLDFSDQVTAEVWMAALEPYMVEEVRQGITEAIANITKTPTVADVLEYVRDVHNGTRRAAEEASRNSEETAKPNCWECNDHGFITVIYPNGDEAVRPCNCQKAEQEFGSKILKQLREESMPWWKQDKLFGTNEIPSQYKLVRVSKITVETGEEFKGMDHKMHRRVKWAYVPYFPRAGKEEVIMQYQKKARTK